MNYASKKYSSLASAKRALNRIFSKKGIFHGGRISAEASFCTGIISKETNELTLKSNYWTEESLKKFISGKESL